MNEHSIDKWRKFLTEAAAEKPKTARRITKGDSLIGLAKSYEIPLSALIGYNPQIKDPNKIYAGQLIYIPDTDYTSISYEVMASSHPKNRSAVWKAAFSLSKDVIKQLTLPVTYKVENSFGKYRDEDVGSTDATMWAKHNSILGFNPEVVSQEELDNPENETWPVSMHAHKITFYTRTWEKSWRKIGKLILYVIEQMEVYEAGEGYKEGASPELLIPEKYVESIYSIINQISGVFLAITLRHELIHGIHKEIDYKNSKEDDVGWGFFGAIEEVEERSAESEKLCRRADLEFVRGEGKAALDRYLMHLSLMLGEIINITYPNISEKRKKAEAHMRKIYSRAKDTVYAMMRKELAASLDHFPEEDQVVAMASYKK